MDPMSLPEMIRLSYSLRGNWTGLQWMLQSFGVLTAKVIKAAQVTEEQMFSWMQIWKLSCFTYHRIIQVERDHCGSPGPTSLIKQGCSKGHGKGLYPDSFRVSPLREIPQSFWAICSSRWSLHSKEVPLHIQVELTVHQFLPVAFCHIAWQHQKEPNSISCHPPFRYLYGWWSPSSVISFEAEQTWLFQAVPSKRDTSVP